MCKWRTRFLRDRLAGLLDEPRPGTPRRITDTQIEQVVVRTLETTPRGATQWSTRELAKATGLRLHPHRSETFKLSPDPQLVEKMRDIVGLYGNPPDHALVRGAPIAASSLVEELQKENSLWYRGVRHASASVVAKDPLTKAFVPHRGVCISADAESVANYPG